MRRRGFLAAGISALVPTGATALSVTPPSVEVERLYLAACDRSERERHRELRREIEAMLEGRGKEEAEKALAAARCPTCGCALASAE